ncbi:MULTISPECIES: SpoIID/LytB domain-containing protein [unclassified Synechococcus]|uniref:SpoIID/LytB domain-containing protein n=1 Tax=Synechococcales TaxID=1890424 RepID=UPI002106D57C|nr:MULTISPECIES: SpoIID/LytB domain-containing protein [unclassified Synechococcus]
MRFLAPSFPRSLPRLTPLALGFGGSLLLAPGCRAMPAVALHWPTPSRPAIELTRPVLWVALGSRLGPAPGVAAAKAPPLQLKAASGRLELEDASGRTLQGSTLSLRWRERPLQEPLLIERSVLGPFSSFETADQAAQAWRRLGVEPVIAHPAEWEVWAPAGTAPPEGFQVRTWRREVTTRLELEATGADGSVIALQGPLRLKAPAGLRWGKGVFQGPFRLQPNAYGGWSLIEQVPLERYLLGVVPHEIGAGSPAAALAAQAVLARTWALRNSHRYDVDGYHLCSDTQCQVYADPRLAGGAVRRAVQATRGQVLSWQGQPIHAVYHASNGGIAAGFEEAWSGAPLPYLQASPDGPPAFARRFALPLPAASLPALLRDGRTAYGAGHPLFRWSRQLNATRIRQALEKGPGGVGQPTALKVLERGPSGRVLALAVVGSTGQRVLRLDAIRRTFRQLPSTLFVVRPDGPGRWSFSGGGFGHGAGLSQQGAIDLGGRGWSQQRILAHYYPGTELVPLEVLSGGL